ncbi:MAG: DUF4982 domain-containing protein [Prevotella sp.]|nr:DUF4982 domain-containing protein [Prevotella sp.]
MKKCLLFWMLACWATAMWGQERTERLIKNWEFSRDKKTWEDVTIPHDWAISGPFDKKWDLQVVAIEQNGEKEKSEKSGRSGALPWIGEGYYRTHIAIDNPQRAELVFDGAMSEPMVYVNGKLAGQWAYGYNAFRVDITPYVVRGDNLLEVHLKNVEESSRWYPGGGLYRPVTLIEKGSTSINEWGTYMRVLSADVTSAAIRVDAQMDGMDDSGRYAVEVAILHPKGYVEIAGHTDVGKDGKVHLDMVMKKPQLWSPETPFLYKMATRLYRDNTLIDEQVQKVGIRTLSVSKEKGFQLNGQTRKFKGVCLHHDLGPLGAAVNKAALIRQVKILKDMGCDAIRTSHNMPSTMQMEVYDSLGMMVMGESFDMWIYPKCKNGYARFFKEWAERDIENLVLCHRNHPSLVMWSIGNEIPEQWSEEGVNISRRLQDLCHRLDPSRPVTQGMDRAEQALKSGFAQVMDVPGFNYRVHKYDNNIKQLPVGFLLGSETASTISSRGVYKFPVTITDRATYPDGQCSSYDTEYCSWSNLPDADFYMQDEREWSIGQFVWTGFDYLGEPTPYDSYWPSRSSYFGICDLAGLPKDRYYLYRSQWNTDAHTIHLLPHWTWKGRKGKVTPVYCYTDYPTAELFVNGKSQGRITKKAHLQPSSPMSAKAMNEELLDRYRLRWNDVRYEPGELRVVVYDKDGKPAGEKVLKTAGAAASLRLEVDRHELSADGEDLAFVTVSMVDADGNEVPDAADELSFEVTGAGVFRAVCNGDATSLEPFTLPQMRLFSGKLVVVVQSTQQAGTMRLTVRDMEKGNRIPVASIDITTR